MAKHKQQQALFDLLRQQRGGDKTAGDARPAPVVRPVTPPAPAAPPAPAPAAVKEARLPGMLSGPMTKVIGPRGTAEDDRPNIPYAMLGLGALAVVCLGIIGYCVVGWLNQPQVQLPVTEPYPPMKVVRTGTVTPGLVPPGVRPTPTQGVVGPAAKGGGTLPPVKMKGQPPVVTPTVTAKMSPVEPPVTETAASGGPLYRVRIAQVGKSDVSDQLLAYLQKHGIDVERETRSGNYILYSAAHVDNRKARELADQVKKILEDFEKETGIPTSHDAYPVQVKKE